MKAMDALVYRIQGLSLEVADLRCSVAQCQNALASGAIGGNQACLEPKVALPDRFSGGGDDFIRFRESCRLYFHLRPMSSGDENQRVGIIISLLKEDAQSWAFSLPTGSHPSG